MTVLKIDPKKKMFWIALTPEGELACFEHEKPVETYMDTMAWGLDMLRKIEEFGLLRHILLRLVLGRYAYRELCGLLESIRKHEYWIPGIGYSIEGTEYNKEQKWLPALFEKYSLESWDRKRL